MKMRFFFAMLVALAAAPRAPRVSRKASSSLRWIADPNETRTFVSLFSGLGNGSISGSATSASANLAVPLGRQAAGRRLAAWRFRRHQLAVRHGRRRLIRWSTPTTGSASRMSCSAGSSPRARGSSPELAPWRRIDPSGATPATRQPGASRSSTCCRAGARQPAPYTGGGVHLHRDPET